MEKKQATHSNVLAWKVSWAEDPGVYNPWGLKELDSEGLSMHTFTYCKIIKWYY